MDTVCQKIQFVLFLIYFEKVRYCTVQYTVQYERDGNRTSDIRNIEDGNFEFCDKSIVQN